MGLPAAPVVFYPAAAAAALFAFALVQLLITFRITLTDGLASSGLVLGVASSLFWAPGSGAGVVTGLAVCVAAAALWGQWSRHRAVTVLVVGTIVAAQLFLFNVVFGIGTATFLIVSLLYRFVSVAFLVAAALRGGRNRRDWPYPAARRAWPLVIALLVVGAEGTADAAAHASVRGIDAWLALGRNGALAVCAALCAHLTISRPRTRPRLQAGTADTNQEEEKSRQAAERQLLVSNRVEVFGLLGASAAHDLKHVLGHIRLIAEHALSEDSADMSRARVEALELISEYASTGSASVVELLETIGRSETLSSSVSYLPQDVFGLRDVMQKLSVRSAITFRFEPCSGGFVYVPRSVLWQILFNLFLNARTATATQPGSWISLRMRREESRVVVDMSDSGRGLTYDDADRVFEFAVSESNSSGMGLYIARALARQWGGDLEYLPLGGTSTFRLQLPLRRPRRLDAGLNAMEGTLDILPEE